MILTKFLKYILSVLFLSFLFLLIVLQSQLFRNKVEAENEILRTSKLTAVELLQIGDDELITEKRRTIIEPFLEKKIIENIISLSSDDQVKTQFENGLTLFYNRDKTIDCDDLSEDDIVFLTTKINDKLNIIFGDQDFFSDTYQSYAKAMKINIKRQDSKVKISYEWVY